MQIWNMLLMAVLQALGLLFFSLPFLHLAQLESYQQRMYVKCVFRTFRKYYGPVLIIAVLSSALFYIMAVRFNTLAGTWGAFIAFLLGSGLFTGFYLTGQKKALVFTARIKRLMAILFGLVLIVTAGVLWASVPGMEQYNIQLLCVFGASLLLLPWWIWLALCIAHPLETAIKNKYLREARDILASRDDLIRVGITGSYGKTSCKYILGSILSEKYNVLVPPGSYNTPMGVTRVVREQLTPAHDVMIAEMGARYVGDIHELCDLVQPQFGLITSIGVQHLETFKTLENIINTKYELIESLPQEGYAFFPNDKVCLPLYRKTQRYKGLYGFVEENNNAPLFMRAENIQTGPFGSRFDLVDTLGQSIACQSVLLGRHNIRNIVGCAAVARAMNMSMREISRGIRRIQPIEHRLQIVATTPVTVIDDAFNANPAGVRASLSVLKEFAGRKIIITPGMVELGEAQGTENRKFGEAMAEVADIVILVGRYNGDDMHAGLTRKGFDPKQIFRADTLEQATGIMNKLTGPGDVVLFENDLPDHYMQ